MRKLTLILIFSLLLFSCSTTEKTFDVTIPTPNIETDVQEGDEGTPMESFTPIVRSVDSIISNFNYAYAVRLTDEIKATGYSISGPYFALGMYDASEKTSSSRFYSLIEIKDILYSYSGDGVFSISGKRPNTVEEILKLSAPEDEIEAFSYALSFNIVRDNISAGIEIDILSLLEGFSIHSTPIHLHSPVMKYRMQLISTLSISIKSTTGRWRRLNSPTGRMQPFSSRETGKKKA